MDIYTVEKIFKVILLIYIFFMGACTFSFLNVVIYRVPNGISFVKGRSFCPKCKHKLTAKDMFPPIISWLLLRGRCRYCGEKVSARYTVVEALGGLVALACVFKFGYTIEALMYFVFFCVLTVVAFVDMDTMEIPNGFVAAALIVGLIKVAVSAVMGGGVHALISGVIGMFCISVPMALITAVIPGAFGGGDIKLMFACGLFLGWLNTLLGMAIGVFFGGLFGMFLLASKKKGWKDHFSFGPFLCIGMTMAVLVGEYILNWYLGFFIYY